MLVLTRKIGEEIEIDVKAPCTIVVVLTELRGNSSARIGIDAPDCAVIRRPPVPPAYDAAREYARREARERMESPR